MTKKIVAIHAHPDDVEIFAGGTLALLASRGHKITIVTMTPGDCGSAVLPPEEISKVRRGEAARAAALIGAEYRCAEFRDLAVFSDEPSRRRVVEILRHEHPDLVLTSSPVDYLCDHEQTSELVRDACFGAPAPNYEAGEAFSPSLPLPAIPHLYFMDPLGGVDRNGLPVIPDFVVDIGSTYQTKREMLAQHSSQREWLRAHHGIDEYLDMMERQTRACGQRAGIEFGEGFRRYKGHPYPQTPLLEELVGSEHVFRGSV
jgi:LmbE family N-acetylglucosaminyl deacetylase